MPWQFVLVRAYVRDSVGGTPEHPIVLPPPETGIWPEPGYPAHPIAPGGPPPEVWPGPGYPAHPIVLPPDGVIGGTPEHPIYYPPAEPGVPAHPIVLPPGGSVGGTPEHPIYYPPEIWPDPGQPAHPIAPGGPPPSVWPEPGWPAHPIAPGGPPPRPAHPIFIPGSPAHPIYGGAPILDPDNMPDHPEEPDAKSGTWIWVMREGLMTLGWVQGPVTENPERPARGLPGDWVVSVYGGQPVWVWLPTTEEEAPPEPTEPPYVDPRA
jgi:hypothetical protein